VTALYEVQPWRAGDGHLATVRLRWLDPASGSEEHLAQDIELGDLSTDYGRTDPHFRLAATVDGDPDVADFARRTDLAARLSQGQ
jgi:hypothetical protein